MEDNQQAEASVRWSVTDPLGNKIVLKDKTFEKHIKDDHALKDAVNRAAIEEQVKYTLTSPRFIVKTPLEGRVKYLDLVAVPEDNIIKIKTLAIVVENNKCPFEVVTWMPRRSINEGFKKGEEIYDARMVEETDLQV